MRVWFALAAVHSLLAPAGSIGAEGSGAAAAFLGERDADMLPGILGLAPFSLGGRGDECCKRCSVAHTTPIACDAVPRIARDLQRVGNRSTPVGGSHTVPRYSVPVSACACS